MTKIPKSALPRKLNRKVFAVKRKGYDIVEKWEGENGRLYEKTHGWEQYWGPAEALRQEVENDDT